MVTPQPSRKRSEKSLPITLAEHYQSMVCALTKSAYDAVSAQQKENIAYQTATAAAVSTLLSGEKACLSPVSTINLTDEVLESHIAQLSRQIQRFSELQQTNK